MTLTRFAHSGRTALGKLPHKFARAIFRVTAAGLALGVLVCASTAQAQVNWTQNDGSQANVDSADRGSPDTANAAIDDLNSRNPKRRQTSPTTGADQPGLASRTARVAAPSEFERYVRTLTNGTDIRRFGAELEIGVGDSADVASYNPAIPPDYLVKAGDEILVTLWGSVNLDLRTQVDRSGRITLPRIGPVMVSGVRYADLPEVINRRVGLLYKNYQVSVALGQLRGIRVYVTGFVDRPGSVVVSALSTLWQALIRGGGPAAAGSYRDIQLRRVGAPNLTLDLYDLLLKGDRSADQLVQVDDVIHVGPVGQQVAIIGSVNRPAIFEVKANETINDLLRMAGGYNPVADRSRLALERLDARATVRITQIDQPGAGAMDMANGDVIRAFNAVESIQSLLKQNVRVRIEGEVTRPGEYVLPAGSLIADALRVAGGVAPSAYPYAAEFTRESVRETQQRNYDKALKDFEGQLTRNSATQRASNADEAAAFGAAGAASDRLFAQLRALKPTGRIVFQLSPSATEFPDLALESGDRLYIPPRPTTVGVFGSVFSTGSYLHNAMRSIDDYLRLAGGPTRGADSASTFVVRANGSVVSSLQQGGYFSRGNQIAKVEAQPGDTIFVPEELNKITWVQGIKDWTQILYQFGIGIAGIRSAIR